MCNLTLDDANEWENIALWKTYKSLDKPEYIHKSKGGLGVDVWSLVRPCAQVSVLAPGQQEDPNHRDLVAICFISSRVL